MRTNTSISKVTVRALSFGVLLIAAGCSDGGGAGDVADNAGSGVSDADIIEPFVGVWDISGNWNGRPDELAYLSIQAVSNSGESVAIVFDGDDTGLNCFNKTFSPGTVSVGVSENRPVFIDIDEFKDGVLTLDVSGNSMNINHFDGLDTNGDGNVDEKINYPASRLGITEIDINLCM